MSTKLNATPLDNMSHLKSVFQELSVHPDARLRPDIARMSRKELEDRFLQLYDESLLLKQHIHKQDDKIKKHSTKMLRLMKDRSRTEHLAVGGAQGFARTRNVEMEEMLEDLQDQVRELQTEKEGLKQRLLVAKHQWLNPKGSRARPYKQVQSRVNSGLKKSDISPSSAHTRASLLEEARAKIHNLENVILSQRTHVEEIEAELQQLRDEMCKKEAEYEDRLRQVQKVNKLRSHIHNNVTQIKLQKELTDKSNIVTALEGQLQEHKQTLKAGIQKLDEFTEQLKQEKQKSRELENRLQISNTKLELLPQQLTAVEQERDQLQESYNKLLDSIFDVSQQQKGQIQEQQLRLQIVQLETELKADLSVKSDLLQKLKAECETRENLAEENKKLQIQFLKQRNELDKLKHRVKLHTGQSKSNKDNKHPSDLSPPDRVQEKECNRADSWIQEHQSETIPELEKAKQLFCKDNKISGNYKAELEALQQKMDSDRDIYEQKLEHQTKLLQTSMAKIKTLQAHLRDITYCPKTHVFRQGVTDEVEEYNFDEKIHLKHGEVVIELQIVCAKLAPSLLKNLGDSEPCTFCTYSFYLFKMHSTPVVVGNRPNYDYKSKYVVSMDDHFLNYLSRGSVTVDLHQAIGADWRTLASGQLPLQQLLKQDRKIHGTIQLDSAELGSVGSVDYWMRLVTESRQSIKDTVIPGGDISYSLLAEAQNLHLLPKVKYKTITNGRHAKGSHSLIPQIT